jgi:hypothetical protein
MNKARFIYNNNGSPARSAPVHLSNPETDTTTIASNSTETFSNIDLSGISGYNSQLYPVDISNPVDVDGDTYYSNIIMYDSNGIGQILTFPSISSSKIL